MTINLDSLDYYIKPGFTDMRQGAFKLSVFIQEKMELKAFSKAAFVFVVEAERSSKLSSGMVMASWR